MKFSGEKHLEQPHITSPTHEASFSCARTRSRLDGKKLKLAGFGFGGGGQVRKGGVARFLVEVRNQTWLLVVEFNSLAQIESTGSDL